MGNYRIVIGSESRPILKPREVAVVVDTLRASSTIITALACGVEQIIPVASDAEAFALKAKGFVVAGESGGIKIPGFDLGNSPVELLKRIEREPIKKLAFKTSNLTPLLLDLAKAWICSSLNLQVIANFVKTKNVCIIAVGGANGVVEDLGVATALFVRLSNIAFDENFALHFIKESLAASHLRKIGYWEDVLFISRLNIYTVLPYYDGKIIRNF